ncbi:hypothetical protein ACI65C_006281 [Semiaphis heraclei]
MIISSTENHPPTSSCLNLVPPVNNSISSYDHPMELMTFISCDSTLNVNSEPSNFIDPPPANVIEPITDIEQKPLPVVDFKNDLASWAVEYKIPLNAVNGLLSVLNRHDCFSELPKDSRTLLGTFQNKSYPIRTVEPGIYYHFGIAKDSYEEAKRKANIAQESSDLSEIEQKETRKKRAKVVNSSPSPSPKKSKSKLKERSLLTPPKVFKNKKVNPFDEDSLSINSFDDSDKDPDFILKSPNICEISSPIGKIRVESMSDSKLMNNKKTELNSNSKSMTDVLHHFTSSTIKPQKIRKLCLLVTTKSLGDSVRRIMSRMFHDNILQKYSTYGFKKKRRFASLESYRIVIDILRTHVKYEMTPEK